MPLAVLLVGAACLVLAATQIDPIRTRITSLLAGRGDSSNNFRINVWMAALQMVQDRPWLGIGPGNAAFNSIYPLYQQPKFNALSAYSVPLEILVETGIPGLMACLGLLDQQPAAGPSATQRERSKPLGMAMASLAALAGLLMQGSTDTIFFRPEVQLIGWFALASLVSRPRPIMTLLAGFDAGQTHTRCRLSLVQERLASACWRRRGAWGDVIWMLPGVNDVFSKRSAPAHCSALRDAPRWRDPDSRCRSQRHRTRHSLAAARRTVASPSTGRW